MQMFFFKSGEHSFLGVLEGLKLWLQLPFLKVNDLIQEVGGKKPFSRNSSSVNSMLLPFSS